MERNNNRNPKKVYNSFRDYDPGIGRNVEAFSGEMISRKIISPA